MDKVRIEYNYKDGNFHFDEITKVKTGYGYHLISPNVPIEKAIEFIHHLSFKFDAFKNETKPYPNYVTILSEFNRFVRGKIGVAENLDRVSNNK